MAMVKGSKHYRVKVVEYRMRFVVLIVLAVLLITVGAVALAYFSGHKIGMSGQEQALSDASRLNKAITEYKARAERFEQELANKEMASQVDRQSSEDVRQEVIVLKDELAKLTEENSFYRGLMAPGKDAEGLTIGAVELIAGRKTNTYDYKVVLQQLTQRHPVLKGKLRFTVFGRMNGIEQRFSLMELSDKVNSKNVTLRFKYFQVVEGTLILPEGFEPEGVEIEAEKTGKKPKTVSKKFGWLVEER